MTATAIRPSAAALRRPERPGAPVVPSAARPRQRALPGGDELRQALQILQLSRLPRTLPALMQEVGERHPRLDRTWTWDHAAAYGLVFDAIATATGRRARSRMAPGAGR